MKAALRTLVELDADGKRIAVLGEMRELGTESERGHRDVGETAATLGVDQLITIGDTAELIAEGARTAGLDNVSSARSTREAAKLLGEIAGPGDLVLVKGSRAARTEEVIEQFGSQHSAFVTSP
jgi:UDP-N-acetylmuramoyl-tripeptide--D-alanyl-D-alanine ligase